MKFFELIMEKSQTAYSPGSDGFPDGSRMNLASKEATQNGPPVSGGPPNDRNMNISSGKSFIPLEASKFVRGI